MQLTEPIPVAVDALAERVRRFRAARGWSQEELSRRIGASLRYISLVEMGGITGTRRGRVVTRLLRELEQQDAQPRPEPHQGTLRHGPTVLERLALAEAALEEVATLRARVDALEALVGTAPLRERRGSVGRRRGATPRISDDTARAILDARGTASEWETAKRFGVGRSTVNGIWNGTRRRYLQAGETPR